MQVLYIDIETTGLDKNNDLITVVGTVRKQVTYVAGVATYHDVVEKCYNVFVAKEKGESEVREMKAHISHMLEQSSVIVAFNGIHFDIPFIAHWLGVADTSDLVAKTLDFCALNQRVLKRRVSLSQMCKYNGITEKKSASGKIAIKWALEKKWVMLEEYCMQDVLVMCKLTEKAITNGLLLTRNMTNRRSLYAVDRFLEHHVTFDEKWTPCLQEELCDDDTRDMTYTIDFSWLQ